MAMEVMVVTTKERLTLGMVMVVIATITEAPRESKVTMAMEVMVVTTREMLSQDLEVMDLLMSMFIRLTMDTSVLNPTAMVTTFMEAMVMERDLLRLNQDMVMKPATTIEARKVRVMTAMAMATIREMLSQ